MVSFGYYTGPTWVHYCVGAIISKWSIITAGHCFYKRGAQFHNSSQIRTGDQNLNDNNWANTYQINTIIKHPNYKGTGPVNDIAIVYTRTEIQFNAHTQPVNLPTVSNNDLDTYANETIKFSGWGQYDDSLMPSDDLRVTNFTVYSAAYCNPLYVNRMVRARLDEGIVFCAGTKV